MKYSVITPVWNRQDCILRCLESVTAQLSPDYEVEHIVVDDGSSDSTLSLLREYATGHSHLSVLSFPRNRGTNAARNAAVDAASGDFIIPLDSDDWFRPQGLMHIHQLVLSQPGYSYYMFSFEDMMPAYSRYGLTDGTVLTFRDMLAERYNGDFNHIVKREIMLRYPFEESLRIYESVFFLRLYREAQRMYYSSQIAVQRERDRTDSVSREMLRFSKPRIQRALDAARLQIRWYADDYRKYGLSARLQEFYRQVFDNALLLCDYRTAGEALPHCGKGSRRLSVAKVFYRLHAGTLYRWLIYAYLTVKYSLLGSKLVQQ